MYHKVKTIVDYDDWSQESPQVLPVNLPLGLHTVAGIPPCALILIEGETNSAKTALVLNTFSANLDGDMPLLMTYSEGNVGQFRSRLRKGGVDFSLWEKRIRSTRADDRQDHLVKFNNPDGLTSVDYLKPPGGEYYKLGTLVSKIWEALGQGVALVCIQKASNAPVGRGGEAIRENATLALTLDLLEKKPGYIISALKIVKCKVPAVEGQNPDGKEIHFGVVGGYTLHPLSPWSYFKDKEREGRIVQYVREMDEISLNEVGGR